MVDVKNRFSVGDELELMTPRGNVVFTLAELLNRNGNPIEVAPGTGHVVELRIPEKFAASMTDHDVEFGLLMRSVV